MKLYSDTREAELRKRWAKPRKPHQRSEGLLLETVDCRFCGAIFVPHLIWPDSPPEQAGLCNDCFDKAFGKLGAL